MKNAWIIGGILAVILSACGSGAEEPRTTPASEEHTDAAVGDRADGVDGSPDAGADIAEDVSPDTPVSSDGDAATGAGGSRAMDGGGATAGAAGGGATGSAAMPAAPAPGRNAGSGAGAQESDVSAILRRASDAYEEVRSLRADFVMATRNDLLRQNTTSRGTLYQQGADRIAVRFSDPAGDLIVGDGTAYYTYYPSVDPKQVMRISARGGDMGAVDLRAQFVTNPGERFEATLERTENVAGRSAYVVSLVPKARAEYRSLKVWLDSSDSLARRFEIVEHNGTVRRFDLSGLQINVSIPAETFRFTPPEGVRVVNAG